MPYQNRRRRGYGGRRRNYTRKKKTRGAIYGAAARQLYNDVSKLKNLINVEFKYHDVQFNQDAHTTGAIVPLNLVAQGDGPTNRDGAQFRMKSLEIKGVTNSDPASTTPCYSRMDLILDTDPNGSTPVLTDIYDTTGSVPYFRAVRNLDNRNRFVILKTWNYSYSPASGRESYSIKFYKQLDIKTLFTGTTATIANLKNNHLFLVITGDTASGSNPPNIACQTRIRYVDN